MLSSKLCVRKAAPMFKTAAWWKDAVKTVSLDDFKGKKTITLFG